ncbi:hypothetical protein RF20_24935 [Salmonella enterica]|nr:hypothetical protein [Salmonella enterica subsp. enterica]EAM8425299.1 hypothetical protein [Salmonella enterica]ECH8209312.1 hypothetical protein [Salmonella enterica subsp. enterica]
MRSSCPGGVGLDDWAASAGQEPKGAGRQEVARGGPKGGKRDCQRTGNPFIKALQVCQNHISPEKAGKTPRLQVATYRWIRKPGLLRPLCFRPLT